MSDNPYQSPMTEDTVKGVLSGKREDLKAVAQAQKGILVCILIYLVAVFGQFAIPLEFRFIIGILILVVGLAGTIWVFLLAMRVYGVPVGILAGIFTMVPCIGLLVLLFINGKATRVLKENGIDVGLLGADMSKL